MSSSDPRFQLYDAIYENIERLHADFDKSVLSSTYEWENYINLQSRFFRKPDTALDFSTQERTSFQATAAVITGFGLESVRNDDAREVSLHLLDDGSPYAREIDLDDPDIEVVEAAKHGQHVISCGPDQPPSLYIFERFGNLSDPISMLRDMQREGLSEIPSADRCLKIIDGLSKVSLVDIDFDGNVTKN